MNNLPTITKNLLIINGVMFLATWLFPSWGIERQLGLYFFGSPNFHFYQLITYMFVHGGFTHVFFNMFALWMFGRVMENVWGPHKFLFFYLLCGIGAGLTQELAQFIHILLNGNSVIMVEGYGLARVEALTNSVPTIGASGAVYGILLSFGMTFPNERLFIFPIPIPIKAKWFVVGYAAIELLSVWASSNDGVAHVAHLGGMLFGLLAILYWRHHPGSDARFSRNRGQEFFNNMKRSFEQRRGPQNTTYNNQSRPTYQTPNSTHETDMEYNARKKQRQAEVDAILDKIRKSGYDSLTKEEKRRLFEASKEN